MFVNYKREIYVQLKLRKTIVRYGNHHQSELVGDVAVPVSARQAVLF